MRTLLLLTLAAASLSAQTLTFSTRGDSVTALPAAYQFPSTAQGSSASLPLQVKNNSSGPVEVVLVYVGPSPGSLEANSNYTVTGFAEDHVLAPGQSQPFTLNFTPGTTGQLLGYLQVAYIAQKSGCALQGTNSIPQCPGAIDAVSTLEGTGLPAQLLLTYATGDGSKTLQPSSPARLDFGSVSKGATSTITFKLTNQSSSPISAPAVSVQTAVFSSSAFALDTSGLPATLPAGGAGTFTVTFAPGQSGLTTAILKVGANSYGIEGTGIVVTDIDALDISFVDATGVRTLPQAASPIDFGQLIPGTAGGATLKFTVANPQTSFNAVTLTTISVTGSAYTLSGAPAMPATIQPNSSISFSVTFTAQSSGTYTGKLTIGTRSFSLTGLSVLSPAPEMSLQLSQSTLTSAQQINVTVEAATAAKQAVLGQLSMQFTPADSNVQDDPAVVFVATNGRTLPLTLAAGTQAATFQGQSALTFQTGTTAGTIAFTLTFPNTAPLTQKFTITPALIHISSAQAVRESPSLVLTLTGFDNTYTAGQMGFTFFDTKGKQINATPMAVDAKSNFHQYFFTNNQAGGSFAMQVSFPVEGDVSQVGSVEMTLTNSAGQTTNKLAFQ